MNALTFLAPIKPGKRKALEEVLGHVQRDPARNPCLRLAEGRSTHCIRCAIIHDDENGDRLLVASEYDGDLDAYLAELLQLSSDASALWGNCQGFAGKAAFPAFIRRNSYETQAFYIAFRDETVQSIQDKARLRERLEDLADKVAAPAGPVLDALRLLPPSRNLRHRARRCLAACRDQFRDWWLSRALLVVKPLATLGETKNFPLVTSGVGAQDQSAGLAPTNLDGQMITVTEVKPNRRLLLRVSLAVNEFLGKYGYAPGLFADVGTLFSFRWVPIDHGKRLIFLSVFDGSWQNYMGDFIDKIIWALDGIYKNTRDYPPGGMSQVTDFQRWILAHQFQPLVSYKAYPTETVMKLVKDRSIACALGNLLETGFDSADLQQLTQDL